MNVCAYANINNDQCEDDHHSEDSDSITLTKHKDSNNESKKLSSKQIKKMTKQIKELQKQQFEIYINNLRKKKVKSALAKVVFLFVCFFIGFFYQTLIHGFDMNMIVEKKAVLQF